VVIDFEVLKKAVSDVARTFHYKDMNEHPGLAGQSPSAEVVARYFFQEVKKGLGDDGEALRRVRVWEAPGCSASFSG
jgi:6-pyruvoyl-tetrahydropterin synthase